MAALKKFRPPALCLVCGVDSGPIRTFLIVFIGSLVAASTLTLLWAIFSRRVSGDETMARASLDAEKKEGLHGRAQ
jgi:hypothetical protein